MRSASETHEPGTKPIPPDWQPSPACRAEAEGLKVSVDVERAKFVAWNLDKGERSADWDARFLVWCRRQVEWAARHPQKEAPIVIPGGRAEPEPRAAPEEQEEPIVGTDIGAQWARIQRELGKGVSRNWLSGAEILGIEDGELTITLPAKFRRDHVVKNYGDRLTTLWRAENPDVIRVNIVVATALRSADATAERRAADG